MAKQSFKKSCCCQGFLGKTNFQHSNSKTPLETSIKQEVVEDIQKKYLSNRKRKSHAGIDQLIPKISKVVTSEEHETISKSKADTQSTIEDLVGNFKDLDIKDVYVLGQNVGSASVAEVVDMLLKRDYPNISNFVKAGKAGEEAKIGPTFVPECYIPFKNDVLNPQEINGTLNQHSLQMLAEYSKQKSVLGRLVYQSLKSHFGQKDDVVLCIQDLKLNKLSKESKMSSAFIDFLVVNYTCQYIFNIQMLDMTSFKNGKLEEQFNNLDNTKQVLEEWFSKSLTGNWTYVSAVFQDKGKNFKIEYFPCFFISFLCLSLLDSSQHLIYSCEKCCGFIFDGAVTLQKRITEIEDSLEQPNKKNPEDYRTLCKYLLFCAPAISLPVRGNLVKSVKKALKHSGSIDNIYLWAFPTPQQRLILHFPKLVFAAPWGSGKTVMMIAEATRLSLLGERVLFIIFCDGQLTKNCKTLLFYDIYQKFQDNENVRVVSILFKDGEDNNLSEIASGFQNIIMDEFFCDYGSLSERSQSEVNKLIDQKQRVWMSLSSSYYGTRLVDFEDIDKTLRTWFPGFELAKMSMTLRMPSNVAKTIKEGFANVTGKASNLEFNEKLFADCDIPTSLVPEAGLKSFGKSNIESQISVLKAGLSEIPDDSFAMIVINDFSSVYGIDIVRNMISCNCMDKIAVLSIDVALQSVGRPKPIYHCNNHLNSEDDILQWIGGEKEQDLVTSFDLIRGFENDIIVDTVCTSEVSSRVTGLLIKIASNSFLDMFCIYEGLLKPYHSCKDIMDRKKRKPFVPNIIEILGEILTNIGIILQGKQGA